MLGVRELPGLVVKRMSGFPSRERALAYVAAVERYLAALAALEVPVAPTELVRLEPAPRRHVVYLLQPRLDPARFGNVVLREGPLEDLLALLGGVLELVRRVLAANRSREDGVEMAIDAQLSNWSWAAADVPGPRPLLIDVGTPFVRRGRELEIGADLFLWAHPAPVRWWMLRQRAVEHYVAAFFRFDRAVTDLLGNFFKEGAAQRLPAAIDFVNRWIAEQPEAGSLGRIDERAVRAYYERDAGTLELSLRARKLRRFVTATLLRRRYDFILPGRVTR